MTFYSSWWPSCEVKASYNLNILDKDVIDVAHDCWPGVYPRLVLHGTMWCAPRTSYSLIGIGLEQPWPE